MFRMEIENVTSKRTFVGEFETRLELESWYARCVQKNSFGVGEVRAGEIQDRTSFALEEMKVIKKQQDIAFGNKMVALISVMSEELDQLESLTLIQKYNHILSYLQLGFLDTASMEIAKVSIQDDNGIEARLKHRLLKEITDYNARV